MTETTADIMPTIVAAALCLGGRVYSLPKPARHHDVIRHMRSQGISPGDIAIAAQGFVTSQGEFLLRTYAMDVARLANQVGDDVRHQELFSEDVW